jgi:hypothetical protein
MYASCPKCGHAPLPQDQAAPAACPACGIILAKFAAPVPPRGVRQLARGADTEEPAADQPVERPSLRARAAAVFLQVPEQVYKPYWVLRIALLGAFAAWTVWIFKAIDFADGQAGSSILHAILIPFHEAGHVLLRWAPEIVLYAGGMLGQTAMPIILAAALLKTRGDAYGAALFAWLLGFSLIDTGAYMYDAYDPHMMLLTGYTGAESANHDWIQVFGDLNLLNRARGIGLATGILGRGIMLAGLAWAGFLLWKQHGRLSDSVAAEFEP